MRLASNTLSESIRRQCAELLNLAAAIDEQVQLQHRTAVLRLRLSTITMYALPEAAPAMEEDYNDLSPDPPEDPTAWRGAQIRRLRNAATADNAAAAASTRAGHGRGAPE